MSDSISEITIYYQNVRGVRTKTQDLFLSALNENFDIIALTETWLTEGINNSELLDDRYIIFRHDRDTVGTGKSRGGGVLLAVHRRLQATQLTVADHLLPVSIDSLSLVVRVPLSNFLLCIHLAYIPPQSTASVYKDYFSSFELLGDLAFNQCLVIGDFNIPEITGPEYDFMSGSGIAKDYYNFASLYNFVSLNGIVNCSRVTLDLVLSNIPSVVISRADVDLLPIDIYHPHLT